MKSFIAKGLFDMPYKKYDHKALSKKIKRLAKTHTMEKAGEKLGLTKSQVAYICQRNEISFNVEGKKKHNQILEKEDIPIIKELRRSGMRADIIAKKFECSADLIRRVVNGRVWNGQ